MVCAGAGPNVLVLCRVAIGIASVDLTGYDARPIATVDDACLPLRFVGLDVLERQDVAHVRELSAYGLSEGASLL